MPEFEFDPYKSAINLVKHGIDFWEAQLVWLDKDLHREPASIGPELRFKFIGRIGERIWSAVITLRDQRIRIISVRRAREKEVARYEEARDRRRDL